jgi:tetratricopeptide (TPR) repeat protein
MRYRYQSSIVKLCIYSFVVVLLIQATDYVRADIAPPAPPSGSNPMTGLESTNVRMVSETILMEIDADSPYDESLAQVTAIFTMHNLGETEEQMEVRFPLAQSIEWGYLCGGGLAFPPITNLKAWVNNHQVPTHKTYETAEYFKQGEPNRYGGTNDNEYVTLTVPCWEHFEVTFPPEEDVIIKVVYTASPYDHWKLAYYGYSYILETGAGWKGTINSADIIVRLPYELNEYNFLGCRPETCTVDINEVRWHYEDFEPDFHSNARVSLLPPHLWQRILVETENTTKNPEDGEAWGRLGKAYKESVVGRSFRYDLPGEEMYFLSKEAYQKAVTLLPNDAGWHYGFADLLCRKAEWSSEFAIEKWQECFEQIKQALEINPKHQKANELLDYISEFTIAGKLVDLSGSEPDYLILTLQPSATATATKIRPSATSDHSPRSTIIDELVETRAPRITKTSQATSTATASVTQTPEPEIAVDITDTPIVITEVFEVPSTPSENTDSNWPLYVGSVLVFVIVAVAIIWRRK